MTIVRLPRRALIGAIAGVAALPLMKPAIVRAAAAEPAADAPVDENKETVLLRIGGDDASTETVMPAIAAAFLEGRGASGIETTPAASPWSLKVTGNTLTDQRVAILIRVSKSTDGLRRLAGREIDIAASGRPLDVKEVRAVYDSDEIPPDAELEVARYALVVAVNTGNPVAAISMAALRAIYTGQITDWRQVGGTPGPIHVYGRQGGSAAQDAFRLDILNAQPFMPDIRELARYDELNAALAADPQGIGYLSARSCTRAKPIDLSLGGRLVPRPTDYSLGTGDYLLGLPLILYRRAITKNDIVSLFFQEVASPRAKIEFELRGLAVTGRQLLTPRIDPPISEEYRLITDNGLRISTTIRFPPGSTELDEESAQQVDELAVYLRHLAVRGDNVVLVGFSDGSGDRQNDRAVSRQFANVVASGLKQRYAYPGVITGFGSDLPLADDAVPAGRRLNRRVETWLRP
jgi:phosphate transport system substrate-binding protein